MDALTDKIKAHKQHTKIISKFTKTHLDLDKQNKFHKPCEVFIYFPVGKQPNGMYKFSQLSSLQSFFHKLLYSLLPAYRHFIESI